MPDQPYITPQPRRSQLIWRARMHRKFRGAVRLLLPFIPEDAACLDIGANHGRFSLELARLKPQRRVVAFEPLRANLDILYQAVRPFAGINARIGPIDVVESGLSDRENAVEIFIPTNKRGPALGSAFVAPEPGDPRLESDSLIRETITTHRLDDVATELNIDRIGFIKIDVEGHERQALEGARATLERDAPGIIVEISPRDAHDGALAFLDTLGYRFFDLDLCEAGSWTDAERAAAIIAESPKAHDVLCWRPSDDQLEPPAFGAPFNQTKFGT